MQTFQTNDYEVAVEQGRVLVSMNPRETETPLKANDFADRPLAEGAISSKPQVGFYAALNETGDLVRVVSMAIADRTAVAALVAGWIAEGLEVTKLSIKDLVRYSRIIEKREKEEALRAKGQAEPAQKTPEVPGVSTQSAESEALQAIEAAAAHLPSGPLEPPAVGVFGDLTSLLGSD